MSEQNLQSQTVQTTGHAWDGDLQEFNNPLPTWWVYTFYVTIVFTIVYWLIYPSWPIGKGFLTGFSDITYVNKAGETVSSHWNTRALLMKDLNEAAERQKPYFSKVAANDFGQIAKDPELSGFVLSAGKALFTDNCAPCHQQGGQGVLGFFPNLTDDDWLYGGSYDKIHQTLINGRRGYMPAFGEVLNVGEIDALANYVASLSGIPHDGNKAASGRALFTSPPLWNVLAGGAGEEGRLAQTRAHDKEPLENAAADELVRAHLRSVVAAAAFRKPKAASSSRRPSPAAGSPSGRRRACPAPPACGRRRDRGRR